MLRILSKPLRYLFTPKKIFVGLCALLAFVVAYAVYLDRVVTQQFEGKRFSLPARVYARPLEIYVGKTLAPADLQWELELMHYRAVPEPLTSGQYAKTGHRFLVHTKPFTFWDGAQEEQMLLIEFRGDQVSVLKDARSGTDLDIGRLEPFAIGGIYPDKNEDRDLVRYEQLPRYLVDALVAVEDQRFYYHHGVDPRSLLRAFVATITGKGIQGGSTLTQQLVKNFFLTPDRTLWRKFKEMLMALLLERRYDKNDILETYVNEVYFGQDRTRAIHGVALASQFYFGRHVGQMELHQAALLVAMLKGPAVYNPRRHPERALKRRNVVLAELFQQGYIPEWQFNQAKQKPLDLSKEENMGTSRYPAFLDLVFRQLRQDYKEADLRSEGLRIFTTLDPYVQKIAEQALAQELDQFEKNQKLEKGTLESAMIVSSAQTGEVEALLGSRRAGYEGFNRALDAKRQVGSLMKPAIYLTALEQTLGYSLATLLDDSPLIWQEPGVESWQPGNYDNLFHGDVPLWQALAKSYNVSSARLGLALGVSNVLATAKRLGVESDMPLYASSLLGTAPLAPIEVAQMYQTLAAGGFRIPLRSIREVLTLEGMPLKRYGLEVEQVVDSPTAYLMTHALQLVVTEGTGISLNKKIPATLAVAGKTGTTDDFRDSWFAGYSGDKVGVVWVGSDGSENTGLTGASGAMQIWGDVFAKVATRPVKNIPPEEIVMVTVDRDTGANVKSQCGNTIVLPFVRGSEPSQRVPCREKQQGESKVKKMWRKIFGD